jgi:peptide/nickel transport system substrate-binding protein
MKRRWLIWPALLALAAAVAIGLAACGGDDDEAADTAGGGGGSEDISAVLEALGGPVEFGTPAKGGTYRMENTDVALFDGFDPTGEYFGNQWMVLETLMIRPLVSYPFKTGAEGGSEVVPDLATEVPEPSADGLTWTFTLKDGVMFAPPVSREITSQDVKYAIERIGKPGLGLYANYYRPIKGFPEYESGDAKTISGIATPDDKTITFTLSQPTGDFLFRIAMPAAAPIPKEVADCHAKPAEYGRYVISSGPYMFEGADKLDISSCASQKPISGFNPNTGMTLVRNPNYDPATDDPTLRESNPDRFEIGVNTNLDNIFDKIERGELDGSFEAPPGAVLRRYLQDADIRDRLRVNAADRIWYMYFNLTVPPFDDVNVRRAMNLVMDLEGIQRAWGGPVQGSVPTHVLPDTMVPELAEGYEPFQKAPYAGDVDAAKEEMKLSAYDTDKDGLCDAPACKGVLHLNRNFTPWSTHSAIITQSAAEIGVQLETREASRSAVQAATGQPGQKLPTSSGTGWGKDYADPSTFMVLFDGRNILADGNSAQPLVGLTAAKAKEVGAVIPASGPPPSVDKDIDACSLLADQERTDCWVALDKKITEEIVPWVGLMDATNIDLIGPAVTKYDFDQFGAEGALAHVAVDPSLQN